MEYRLDKAVMEGELGDFPVPASHIKVDETKWEALWDRLMREHHYLGYDSVIGSRVKYLVTLGDKVVGAISFCSAAFKLGPRDKYLGWDEATRLSMLPHLVNNNRFLILPWVRIRNLASHVLSESLKRLRVDWEKWYGVEPYLVETFVDPERFAGTCYAAANWVRLGQTKGYGRQGNGFVYHGRVKDLYVKVMNRRLISSFHPDTSRLSAGFRAREELIMLLGDVRFHRKGILNDMGVGDLTYESYHNQLAEHLAPYIPFLNRKVQYKYFTTMVNGLLSDVPRKNVENIHNDLVGVEGYRNEINFLTRSTWDHEGMSIQHRQEGMKVVMEPGCMLTIDGTDFRKKGKNSVGVAHQYYGPTGYPENCQASVMGGIAGKNGWTLLGCQLFMPKSWFDEDHADLRAACGVPEGLEYKTKNQIAMDMIREFTSMDGFQGKYVGFDSAFGRDHALLDSIPEGLIYFADVSFDTKVFASRPEVAVPEYCGRGRRPTRPVPSFPPITVKELVESCGSPRSAVVFGPSAEGLAMGEEICLRVVESREGLPGKDVWLYVRFLADGKIKYSLCNAPMDASIDEIRTPATMRWSIEQCFWECKKYLGMDQYELRSWHGWRRHMLLVFICHLFVTKLRLRFSVTVDEPGPGPCVKGPVTQAEYAEAVVNMHEGREITHPNMCLLPDRPQCLLTFHNVVTLISPFIIKIGRAIDKVDKNIKNYYDTYIKKLKHQLRTMLSILKSTPAI